MALAAGGQTQRKELEPVLTDMQRSIDRHLQTSRAGRKSQAISDRTDLVAIVLQLSHALRLKHHVQHTPRVICEANCLYVGVAHAAVMEIAGNVIENAIRHGLGDARIQIAPSDSGIELIATNGIDNPCSQDIDLLISRSGGLGLDMTREIAAHHGISFSISTTPWEFSARLEFPVACV